MIAEFMENKIKKEVKKVIDRWYLGRLCMKDIDREFQNIDLVIDRIVNKFFGFGEYNFEEIKKRNFKEIEDLFKNESKGKGYIEKIIQWLNNDEKILGEYSFSNALSKDTVISFMRIDIEYLVYMRLRLYYLLVAKVDCSNKTFKSLKSKNIITSLKKLNRDSRELLKYLISKKDEEFLVSHEVFTSHKTTINELSLNYKKVDAAWVVETIMCLNRISIEEMDSMLMGFSDSVLTGTDCIPDLDVLRVGFNRTIVNELIINATVKCFKYYLDGIKEPLFIELFFEIQRLRVIAFVNKVEKRQQNLILDVDINFFSMTYDFFNKENSNYKQEVIFLINKIVADKIIIKNYEIKDSKFIFEFYLLSKSEIEQYIYKNDNLENICLKI